MTQSPVLNILQRGRHIRLQCTPNWVVLPNHKCCLRYVTEPVSIFIPRISDAESPDMLIDNRKRIINFKVLQ